MIARLLIGQIDHRRERISAFLKEVELKNPHPDLLYIEADSKLGIEQARIIKEYFSLKPYQSRGRGVILEDATDLTLDAQNALLKTLEELPQNALFILGADSDSKFLPTVLSRCQIVRMSKAPADAVKSDNQQISGSEVERLLAASITERFEYVEKLKDKNQLLQALLTYFHKKLPKNAQFTKKLLETERWSKQNVNIRAILEYLMLVMPKKV